MYERNVEFNIETWLIYRRGFLSQTTQMLTSSRYHFAKDGKEINTEFKNARAELMFYSLDPLFSLVLVAAAVVVC